MNAQNETTSRPVVLAIEDEPHDIEIMRLAMAKRGVDWEIIPLAFAKDAIMYLERVGKYADTVRHPWPAAVVLDLGLPGMNGLDFLVWARTASNLPPIVILSCSDEESNRLLAQKCGAKGYFVKTTDLKDVDAMIEKLLSVCAPLNAPQANLISPQNPSPGTPGSCDCST